MRKTIASLLALLLTGVMASAQTDTLRISTAFTTHVIFPSDLTYADLSNITDIAARIIEQNRNMLALRARSGFDEPANISCLESSGRMHSFILVFDPKPSSLILDLRGTSSEGGGTGVSVSAVSDVTRSGRADVPQLPQVTAERQHLYHLGARQYGISVLCTNIISCSDRTFIAVTLRNQSGVSYEIADATFVIESRKGGRRKVEFEQTLFPQSRAGSLCAAPGETASAAWSFDKLTLSKDQVLKVYFYEESGQRNLDMTIDTGDINHAMRRL